MTLRVDGAASLLAGAAKVDITPPLDVGLLMSSVEGRWSPFVEVRKPLFARALVLEETTTKGSDNFNQRVAVVALDLLALSGKALGGFQSFKSRIADATGGLVAAEGIVVACTHTHTAPESGALTDLYRTQSFQQWIGELAELIGQAIASAVTTLTPCVLSYGSANASGLGIHRRLKTSSGILMSHPEPPDEIVLSRDGAVDDSVNVLWLRNHQGEPVSIVVNATCHPVYEMCNQVISPDYPGELCSRLEADHPTTTALFLNGAAGNINPQGVSAGPEAAETHAELLHAAVKRALSTAETELNPVLALRRSTFRLPTRLPDGQDCGREIWTEIAALRLGRTALAFLPGEPFVETGNDVRSVSPFEWTGIVGFSEESIGYIPTNEAFAEGGYEIGFGPWSLLSPGSEPVVRKHASDLLQELMTARSPFAGQTPHAQGLDSQGVNRISVAVGSSNANAGGGDE